MVSFSTSVARPSVSDTGGGVGGASTAVEGRWGAWADADETTADGRWVYKLSAKGKQDGADVVQTFYLIAGPGGDQVTVTFLSAPEKAAKLADREAELLKGVGFPERK